MFQNIRSDIRSQLQTTEDFYYSAYDLLNHRLHQGRLPGVRFAFSPLKKLLSQFKANKVIDLNGDAHDQITMCSHHLMSAEFIKIIAALDDAMISQDQHYNGTAGMRCYRNKERASMSKEIGLYPSSTGEKGGKETGYNVDYYIISGSPFEQALQELQSLGFKSTWEEIRPELVNKASTSGKRYKYICPHPECSRNYLSGIDAYFICPDHSMNCVLAN